MKKMKFLLLVLAAVFMMTAFAACAAEEPAAEEPAAEEPAAEEPAAEEPAAEEPAAEETAKGTYDFHIGLIQPGPEDYYQNYANSVKAAAEHVGMTVTPLLTEYDSAKEISNYEDLISQGVDAIACFSIASDTAQIGAQLCNEAGIPLFLMSSTASEGEGVPACTIGNSFYDMGYQAGEWVSANLDSFNPDGEKLKILEIQGQLGQGIAEFHSQGFAEALDAGGVDYEIVFQQTSNWIRSEAITITEDAIMANMDFNMVFVHNEDTCAGVVSVLEENDMLENVWVVTMNGSDTGINFIKEGKILCTIANPPSYVGGDVVGQMMNYFDGEDMVNKVYDSPTFSIDETNVNDPDLVTWDVSWAIARVDEYLAGTAN